MNITLGALVRGGTSLEYKTGIWRDQRPVIHTNLCKACDQCESVCPDNALHVVEEVYIVDYEYCKDCGLCGFECPVNELEKILKDTLSDHYEFLRRRRSIKISVVQPDPGEWKLFHEQVADRYPIEEPVDFREEFARTLDRSEKHLYLAYESGRFMTKTLSNPVN